MVEGKRLFENGWHHKVCFWPISAFKYLNKGYEPSQPLTNDLEQNSLASKMQIFVTCDPACSYITCAAGVNCQNSWVGRMGREKKKWE